MPILSVNQINNILEGRLVSASGNSALEISSISIDSRTIFDPASSLFFAIKTERNDGHRYIADLVHIGVKAFVVSDPEFDFKAFPSAAFILVPDTLAALQSLAAWHRNQFSIPIVGITGSNGKTIVKEWLFDLLGDLGVIRSPKSYNSQVGVPLSVWNLSPEYNLAIFEAGISMPGEMQHLQEIIRPTVGILTNIGEAHQENFASKREKLIEKMNLFRSCETVIYCKDQELVNAEIGIVKSFGVKKLVSWSFIDEKSDLFFKKNLTSNGTEIAVTFEEEAHKILLPFQDDASLENAGHCLAFVLSENYISKKVVEAFAHLQPVAMRLEIKDGVNNCLLINDYYNSDINSLRIALSFMNSHAQPPYLQKTVIFSDIQQAGIPDEQLYSEIAHMIRLNNTDRLIGIGERLKKFSGLFEVPSLFYESTSAFLDSFDPESFRQECILLKGARDFHFERISSALQKKYHQTVLEIDLNALVGNLNFFRSLIKPETKVMVMVKAFSYGSGMAEIARILQFHKVDYLAVAVADEGIELRQAGIDLPIIIMNPEKHSFENMIEFRLEPNIYSEEIFDSFRKALQQSAVLRYPVHLKIDTGMHRLGFDSASSVENLMRKLVDQEEMVVRSVFSHLAGSDEAIHDNFTREQVQRFEKLSSVITARLPYKVIRHILNSAGIERFPEFQFEMVRLGIGLYGISADGNTQVKTISRLKTSISQIRTVCQGETIGYGRQGVAKEEMQIAVIPVGYADGYDRRLSNGVGKVFVRGQVAQTIGVICMDMCMIDITGLNAAVGDEVELMGEHILVSRIAETIGTIPYEFLTGISQRVKRIYLQE